MYFVIMIEELDAFTTRNVGYFRNFVDAYDTVIDNKADIWETCYDYAVITKVEEGVYGDSENVVFFKYNMKKNKYEEIDTPEPFKNVPFRLG